MPAVTRELAQSVQEYYDEVEDGNSDVPSDRTLRAISSVLDDSFYRSYQEVTGMLSNSSIIDRGVVELYSTRTCGGFKAANRSLSNLTPFEQMFTASELLRKHPELSRKPRTYAFSNGNEVVPVWIKHPKNGPATLWTTVLGSTTGRQKAPTYQEMAEDDPRAHYSWIENPLTALEMHRNPTHIGALALKSAAYDEGRSDHKWRYQNYDLNGGMYYSASAELKRQKSAKTRQMVAMSAGYNFAEFLDDDERKDREHNLLPKLNFEDFSSEGYQDNTHPVVTPMGLVRTFPDALKGDTAELDRLTSQVFAARLGRSEVPKVNAYVLKTLFDIDLGAQN